MMKKIERLAHLESMQLVTALSKGTVIFVEDNNGELFILDVHYLKIIHKKERLQSRMVC